MKILITCFDAFGGETTNASMEAVRLLPDEIAGAQIVKLTVPTVFGTSIEAVLQKVAEEDPDAVLAIGQAGGRPVITVERIAVNRMDALIADNAGNVPEDEPVVEGGPDALFATVPVKEMVHAMQEAGVPADISDTAGLFVCNQLLYGILHALRDDELETLGGFIHIPYSPEQAATKKNMPSMSTETVVKGLVAAVRSLVETSWLKGIRLVYGWHIPEEEADEYIRIREGFAAKALDFYAQRFHSVRRDFKGSQDGEAVLGLDEKGELQCVLHLDPMNIEAMQEAEKKGELEQYFRSMC